MNSERFDPNELRLARLVLDYARKRISAAAPALLAAAYALRERPCRDLEAMGTDGTCLFYNPAKVLEDFRRDRDEPARQLLHIVFHCLLGHLESRREAKEKETFDSLADCKVDVMVSALIRREGAFLDGWNDPWDHCFWHGPLCGLSWYRKPLAALYREMCEEKDPQIHKTLAEWGEEKRVDDHDLWDRKKLVLVLTVGSAPGGEVPPNWKEMLRELCDGQNGFSKLPGDVAGILREDLEPAEENGISYGEFLRRFSCISERMITDPDSIDHRWYNLGLELYGDIPILEPCEVSEPPRPDDLVIALDTSGSCNGDVCRRFLRETLNLLADVSAGGRSFRVLLLQCDAEIQQERFVENRDQIDSLITEFTPSGFGGTSFIPVFERISQLREEGALPRVRGLLYLSDGLGEFPDKAPDYPVAFLVPQSEDWWEPEIPDWVCVLTLNEHDYTVKEAVKA